jgi:hypothetical protein|tara:strand:+ start:160 stop:363 length:204 start_codon:yes stop_codon:yes gene_type:complete
MTLISEVGKYIARAKVLAVFESMYEGINRESIFKPAQGCAKGLRLLQAPGARKYVCGWFSAIGAAVS